MGFPQDSSETAVKEFGTVQASIDAILAGKGTMIISSSVAIIAVI